MVEQPNSNPAAAVGVVSLTNSSNTNHNNQIYNINSFPLKDITGQLNNNNTTISSNNNDVVGLDQVKLDMTVTTGGAGTVVENIAKLEAASVHSLSHHNHHQRKRRKWCDVKKINGKAIKRPIPCLFAFTLLISATASYYSLVAPELLRLIDEYHWFALVSCQSALFLYVLVNFMIAVLIDPGRFQKFVIAPDDPNFNDDTKSPLYKTISIKNTAVKIKWCSVRLINTPFSI